MANVVLIAKILGLTAAGVAAVTLSAEAAGVSPLTDGGRTAILSGQGRGGDPYHEPDNSRETRHNRIQEEINKLLVGAEGAHFRSRLITAKIGGASGVPASSHTVKLILSYEAGRRSALYPDLGDIISNPPNNFNMIAGGSAGRWTESDFPYATFSYPRIEQVSLDEGNDFGLDRHVGTWLEETFHLSCLIGVIEGVAATLASGATLSGVGLATATAGCRK